MMEQRWEMKTDYTINHHWVPLELFERLSEVHPTGRYVRLDINCWVFKTDSKTVSENWFLHGGSHVAEWNKRKEEEE